MPGVLGPDVIHTLTKIHDELGLDYGGIDFTLDAQRNVVVFEANATMVILPPSTDPRSNYRVAPVERAMQAVRALLLSRAQRSSHAVSEPASSTR
jgi:glutathione synthase/RimK-type ligase-like ATP-grasp enzyme